MDVGRLGVRARAMLLVLIATVPFGLLIYRTAEEQRAQHRLRLVERAEHLGRVAVAKYSEMLSYASEALTVASSELRDGEDDDCEKLLRRIANASPAHSLSLADISGRIRCSSVPGAAGVEVGDRDYFQRAISSRGFSTSGVTRGRISDRVVVLAGYPVLDDDGDVAAVLVAEVALDWIPRALAEADAPHGFAAAMISESGEPIQEYADARTLSVAPETGRMFLPGQGLQAAAGAEAEVVAGQVRLPTPLRNPAFLRIALPASLADEPADKALREGLALLAAMFVLVLALAWLGATYFVVRPLRRLEQAAARLDSGDLEARTGVAHSGHEIGRLARALDGLAAHRQKVTRALRALSEGNRTLLREQNEDELLEAMCRVAVERGGYPLAVVYYAADDDEKSILPVAHAGDDRGAIDALKLTWEDNEQGQGTVARAIRGGRTTVFQSIAAAPGALPWRADLLKRGFGSVTSMPLRVEERVIGTFTLFAGETDAFDREELELVQEMADDLAFGIAACRERLRRIDAEHETRRAATHDRLTDLYNRSFFLNALNDSIAGTAGASESIAVLVIHVRDMPALLDGLGYEPGTQAVREIAQRLGRFVSERETLARVPPDDFAVLCAGTDAEGARRRATELLEAFAAPVAVGGARIDVQGHVGASFYPGHGDGGEALLRRAAIAAREGAKRDQSYTAYAGATERENPARLALVADLRRAIESRDLRLHFQPKVDLASGRIVGAEALVRWQHPKHGNIPPGQFVPLAEQTGLIRPMTYLVMDAAIRQQRAWLDEGVRLPVAVNLSVRNFYDPRLAERVHGLLATWGVPAELLEFEITEGALVEEPQTARAVLERLRQAGSRVSIDDFGTGYSSLSYLVSLPVHALKIDRSFIVQMSGSEQARAVVASIISMGQKLGLRVVAEGVERPEDRDALIAMGCDEAQGYLFGRPMEAGALRAALAQDRSGAVGE